jgi:hypothetical protein
MQKQNTLMTIACILAFALVAGVGSQVMLNHAFASKMNVSQYQALQNKVKGQTSTALNGTQTGGATVKNPEPSGASLKHKQHIHEIRARRTQ